MGGMDNLFMSHANMDILHPSTFSWSQGPKLPWAQSGALGTVMGGAPTLFGGFGMGFRRGVASFRDGVWEQWGGVLDSSRVSGLAVSVPQDMFDYC